MIAERRSFWVARFLMATLSLDCDAASFSLFTVMVSTSFERFLAMAAKDSNTEGGYCFGGIEQSKIASMSSMSKGRVTRVCGATSFWIFVIDEAKAMTNLSLTSVEKSQFVEASSRGGGLYVRGMAYEVELGKYLAMVFSGLGVLVMIAERRSFWVARFLMAKLEFGFCDGLLFFVYGHGIDKVLRGFRHGSQGFQYRRQSKIASMSSMSKGRVTRVCGATSFWIFVIDEAKAMTNLSLTSVEKSQFVEASSRGGVLYVRGMAYEVELGKYLAMVFSGLGVLVMIAERRSFWVARFLMATLSLDCDAVSFSLFTVMVSTSFERFFAMAAKDSNTEGGYCFRSIE
ncbi:hypothetical protein Tco_0884815 [Tanacetum coccineum]